MLCLPLFIFDAWIDDTVQKVNDEIDGNKHGGDQKHSSLHGSIISLTDGIDQIRTYTVDGKNLLRYNGT